LPFSVGGDLGNTSSTSFHPSAIAHFVVICARIGERDLAIEQLQLVTKKPSGPSYGWLRLSPLWDLATARQVIWRRTTTVERGEL
jgi:hypothetical protein